MANINDEPEHLFDQVVRIGYGIEICKYLWWHDLAALACVDTQCAEAVRWQKEKGNTKAIWSQDINYHVIFRFKNINVTTNFPVKNIAIKTYTINVDNKTNTFTDMRYMRAIRQKKVIPDQYNRIIVIVLYGKYVFDSYGFSYYEQDEEILVNYEDRDTILDSWKYFYAERIIYKKQKEEEQLRQERIRQEEEQKRLEEERKKRWHEKYDPILQKPNPWVKRH
jgi:hypothetical protein